MSDITADSKDALRRIVRGEWPLKNLEWFGMVAQFEGNVCHVTFDSQVETVSAEIGDVAWGFIMYLSEDPEKLYQWAAFLLSPQAPLSLGEVEAHPEGYLLLEALWNASYHEDIEKESIDFAERVISMTK